MMGAQMITNSLSYFQLYNLFADACSIPKGSLHDRPNLPAVNLAWNLVNEEHQETRVALTRHLENPSLENLVEVADGIADTIYVLCQLARSLGIDLDAVFAEVQRSNMAKVMPDGKVKRREDGKILKPDGWTPPNIFKVLHEQSNREAVQCGTLGSENWNEYKKQVKPLKADDNYPAASNS